MQKKIACLTLALVTLLESPVLSANVTWSGGGADNLWSNPANWLGGTVPVGNDTLIFAGVTNVSTFNDLAAGTKFNGITFAASSGAFVWEGNAIELGGNLSNLNTTTERQAIRLDVRLSGPSVFGLTANTFLEVDGVISGAGSITLNNGGALMLNGQNTYQGTTRVNSGNVIVTSIGNVGESEGSLGAPTTAAAGTISLAGSTGVGMLTYLGTGETTDRVINLGGVASSAVTGVSRIDQSGSGHLKFTSDFTAVEAGNKNLNLLGSSEGTGELAGAIVDNTGNMTSLAKLGRGTWTLSGNNSFSGITTLEAGVLKLDYSTNNGSKLSDTAALVLDGGRLELVGGSDTEVVASATVNVGGSEIARSSGSSKLALGAITFSGGALNFSEANIATTTTANVNGILSQRATVAGSDFAANDGSGNIVAYAGYTTFAGAMAANTNYSLAGSASLSGNTGAASNTLKIAPASAGQSLSVGANTFTLGALLFTGDYDYTISTSAANKLAVTSLHNYGTGDLYYGSIGSTGLTQYGTGRTILTAATTTNGNMAINGGIVQFSANDQLANPGANRIVTLNSGTLVADTAGGSIALDNGGVNSRNFTLNYGGGTIDVIGGNSLTISGVISGNGPGSGVAGAGLLTLGSADANGTIFLAGANTYKGSTVLRGGVVNLGVAEVAGTSGPLGASRITNPGSILFEGGTLQYSAVNQFDYSGRFAVVTNQQYRVDTKGQNVTWGSALVSQGGSVSKFGAGNLTLVAENTYTGITTISEGSLILSGQGSIANSALIRLSGGALDVGGVAGGFSVASGQVLAGAGGVIGDVALSSGSFLSIGSSPGTMSFDGALSLHAGSTSTFEIDGLTAGLYDLATGVGSQTVTFGGTLELVFQTGFNTTGSIAIFHFENYERTFSTINVSGLASGYTASFDELTGSVIVAAVPEPSAGLLLTMGLTICMVLRRRRHGRA